ncbi:hypothetical protein LX36DRAFT_182942 [Colletotrichum falcatum]|nr:hypothetical protein LX36DRAFT_182942 [Colletotrichum falcatum]
MYFYSVVSTLFALATAVSATPVSQENYLAARDSLAKLQSRVKVCAGLWENCGILRGKLPCCSTNICRNGICVEVRVFPAPWGKV